MCRQRAAIDLRACPGWPDALGDIKDDAGEAVLVDVDLLVVGDLSQFATHSVRREESPGESARGVYLTSAKLLGRSQMMAPPYSGVLLYLVMTARMGTDEN